MDAPLLRYTVDALFAAEKLIVELDGYEFHSDRAAFESDRDRDADTLAAGFATVRITWYRIHETAVREAARLHRILAGRRTAATSGRPASSTHV
jgi:very-short-patch-repair endonuclease